MSPHEIANNILAWLEGVWNHPIPWGQLFIFAGIIAGIMGASMIAVVSVVLISLRLDERRNRKQRKPVPEPVAPELSPTPDPFEAVRQLEQRLRGGVNGQRH
jgi:hypothetical protein